MVPAWLGAHAAMAGAFRLMEFAKFQPVAYLESTTSSLFLELPEEIAACRDILAATALGEEQASRPRTASCPGTRLQGPRRPRPGRPHLSLADVPHHRHPLTTVTLLYQTFGPNRFRSRQWRAAMIRFV
ncbi:MAG: Scr1 family TA system antitoxin-like transcriptional regulator [Pseudonocardiaceae bacterium]